MRETMSRPARPVRMVARLAVIRFSVGSGAQGCGGEDPQDGDRLRRGAGREQKDRDAHDRDDEDDLEHVARRVGKDRQLASGMRAAQARFAEAGRRMRSRSR